MYRYCLFCELKQRETRGMKMNGSKSALIKFLYFSHYYSVLIVWW